MKQLSHIAPIIVALCVSCSGKDTAETIVDRWYGKTVALPDNVRDVLTDSFITLSDADFTIFTYVSDKDCTGCSMKLYYWTEFLESLDSIATGKVNAVTIVNTTDRRKLKYIIKSHKYRHSVFMDSTDDINRQNSFPDDDLYRSFLLSKDHKVLAVGNPVHDPAIADLYRNIVSGNRPDVFKLPKSTKYTYDLGHIAVGEKYSGITIKNESPDTLHIRKIISSCDCMEVMVPADFIKPGGSLPITVSFNKDAAIGDFFRDLRILYNENTPPTNIELNGTII